MQTCLNLLAEAIDPSLYNKKISLGEAAIDALLGFTIVFVGIALLVFIVWAVGKLMQTTGETKKADDAAKKVKPPMENAKNTEVITKKKEKAKEELAAASAQALETEGVSEETVAVITAAIAAIYANGGRTCGFVVKRIKRS